MYEYLMETVTGKTYRFKLNEDVVHSFQHSGIYGMNALRVICDDGIERTFIIQNIVCIQRNK